MSQSSYNHLLELIREEGKKLNPQSLLKRHFVTVQNNNGQESAGSSTVFDSNSNDVIRILQWNLLAQGLCQDKDGFILCPNAALDWDARKYHILEELLCYFPDVLCLQEVDQFSFLESHLQNLGYKGVFFPKPDSPCLYTAHNNGPDGCAVFWNTHKVKLLNHTDLVLEASPGCQTNQVAIICKFELQCQDSDRRQFFVATTHLKSKVAYHKLRLCQGSFLENYLAKHCEGLPLILSGDFNAEPSEEIITLVKNSKIGLCSSYSLLSDNQNEPPYTTWKVRGTHNKREEICHTIDYLFFTHKHFRCLQLLKFPTQEEMGEGLLPSFAYPSDHLSLLADLRLSSLL